MHINFIQATNIELSDALRDYVEKKLSRVAEKHIDPTDESATCDVEIGKTTNHHKSGDIFRAEFNLHVAGKYIYADAETEELYAAIDEAKDELERQLRSHQEKKETMLRKGGRKLKQFLRGNA